MKARDIFFATQNGINDSVHKVLKCGGTGTSDMPGPGFKMAIA